MDQSQASIEAVCYLHPEHELQPVHLQLPPQLLVLGQHVGQEPELLLLDPDP